MKPKPQVHEGPQPVRQPLRLEQEELSLADIFIACGLVIGVVGLLTGLALLIVKIVRMVWGAF